MASHIRFNRILLLLLFIVGSRLVLAETTAINGVETHPRAPTVHKNDEYDELKLFVFCLFLSGALYLMSSTSKGEWAQVKQLNDTNQRIIRAIYSKPHLKTALADLQLGNVPPIGDLASFGGHAKRTKAELGRRYAIKNIPYFGGLLFGGVMLAQNVTIYWFTFSLAMMLAGHWALIKHTGVDAPMPRQSQCCECKKIVSDQDEPSLLGDAEVQSLVSCKNCNDTGVCVLSCTKCDDSHSLTKTMMDRPVGCVLCSVWGYRCGAIVTMVRRLWLTKPRRCGEE